LLHSSSLTMSEKTLTCEEAMTLFQGGRVHLTEPSPYQTSLSAELKFTGFDGATIAFTTEKLTTTNYGPVSPAEMPKKDTFPLPSNTKLNVSVVPNKSLADMCIAAQEFIIKAIEDKRSLVRFSTIFFPLYFTLLTYISHFAVEFKARSNRCRSFHKHYQAFRRS